MKIKAPRVEIPPEDPFKNDLLSRKTCAEQLTKLLKSSDESLVLCIDAPWGDGKTTFIKMWRAHLNQEGFKTLYFNAWENDQSDDALVSLIGELSVGMKGLNLKGTNAKKATEYLNRAKKLGAAVIKKGIPAAIRIGTGGLLDLPEISEGTISKLSELAEEIAKEEIEKYENSKNMLNGFKKQLQSFAEEATAPMEGKERLPLIIMIDELDRCRPTPLMLWRRSSTYSTFPPLLSSLPLTRDS
jgi:predicted KAP-like P-loop ATPase